MQCLSHNACVVTITIIIIIIISSTIIISRCVKQQRMPHLKTSLSAP